MKLPKGSMAGKLGYVRWAMFFSVAIGIPLLFGSIAGWDGGVKWWMIVFSPFFIIVEIFYQISLRK